VSSCSGRRATRTLGDSGSERPTGWAPIGGRDGSYGLSKVTARWDQRGVATIVALLALLLGRPWVMAATIGNPLDGWSALKASDLFSSVAQHAIQAPHGNGASERAERRESPS
jgi:hypothetical protein